MDSMNLAPSPVPSPAPSPADTGICELSPYARAFSTVLTAFVGSIIGGLTSGFHSAFFTSSMCWFGTLRVVIIGLFEVAVAVACLVLGVIAAVELVVAAIELRLKWYIIVLYIVFMLMSTFVGFGFSLPNDGGMSAFYVDGRYSKVVAGLLMGAFGGLFSASPALQLMMASKKTPGSSLSEYVRCQPVALWRKFICMFP